MLVDCFRGDRRTWHINFYALPAAVNFHPDSQLAGAPNRSRGCPYRTTEMSCQRGPNNIFKKV
eukprot:scaffold225803_cov38-Prasinocladus_malaysianus.AAC.5